VANCDAPRSEDRVYESSPRGKYGRMPWTYTLGASITYLRQLADIGQLRVKFAVYNLLNEQRTIQVDQDLQTTISNSTSSTFEQPLRFQSPRFAQLTVSVDF
jgi:hypothetical protein